MLDELLRAKARSLRDINSDDLLSVLGLGRRTSAFDAALPTGLAFVAGFAAGAGVALLLAPKSGREMRQDLSNRASELSGKLTSAASDVADQVRHALPGGEAQREPVRSSATAGTGSRSPS
jgi:YtxH-like protein